MALCTVSQTLSVVFLVVSAVAAAARKVSPHCAHVLHPSYPAEPLEVIEPTVVAALNMEWDGPLNVYVCDDGKKAPVDSMVQTLKREMR